MFREKKILVIVPARGGSKGIKLKNITNYKDRPLISHVGVVLRELPWIDRSIVSTDHCQIKDIAIQAGLDAPFVRPKDISGDRISDYDVLNHALKTIELHDRCQYDIILMLQPTSPMRKAEDITGTVNMLIDGSYDAVWTVSETNLKYHPLKQLTVNNGELDYYDKKGDKIIARQQLTPLYHRNGICYAISRKCLLEKKSIKGKKTGAFIIDRDVISIDTIQDLQWGEFIDQSGAPQI